MSKKKKQDQERLITKMKEQGIEVIVSRHQQNLFKRFWEWLSYLPRDIRHFFHERKDAQVESSEQSAGKTMN